MRGSQDDGSALLLKGPVFHFWSITAGSLPSHSDSRHQNLASLAQKGTSTQAQDDDRRRQKAKEAPKKLPTVSLTLVSFAVTRKAYERITQRFAADYEARTGQAVRFRLSFGGSGTQVRQF